MDKFSRFLSLGVLVAVTLGLGLIFLGLSSFSRTQTLTLSSPTPQPSSPVSQESSPSATLGISGQTAQVLKVIDGDTIEVGYGGKSYRVRYIGVDTPETVDPRRPVGCFGKEASNENKNLVEGKEVILRKDVSEIDKYDRLLRYVYLPMESGKFIFINDYLVRGGFAKAVTYPPDIKFTKQFLEAEKEAVQNQRGLWKSCP